MTEAVSIPPPGLARAGRAVTLARVLWWIALFVDRARSVPDRGDLSRLLDHLRRAGAHRRRHAAARQGRVHLRAAAPAAGAGRRGARPLSRRLPFAERRRHVDRGPPHLLRAGRPPRRRAAGAGAARRAAVLRRLAGHGLAVDRAAMSAGSRRRSPSSCSRICRCFSPIPGWRRPMRRLPRPSPRHFSRSCCGWNGPRRCAAWCSASPLRWRCAQNCRRCCSCPPPASPSSPIAGCCDRRSWRPTELFWPWHRAVVPLAALFVAIWAIYGCHADPLYGIRSLADGVRELTAFAEERRAVVLPRRGQRARQLGFLPGPVAGQVADPVSARQSDRRGRPDRAGIAATGSAWRRCSAPSRSSPASCRRRSTSGCATSCRCSRCWRSWPGSGWRGCWHAPLAPQRMAVAGPAAVLADRRSGRRRAGLSAVLQPAGAGPAAAHRGRLGPRLGTGCQAAADGAARAAGRARAPRRPHQRRPSQARFPAVRDDVPGRADHRLDRDQRADARVLLRRLPMARRDISRWRGSARRSCSTTCRARKRSPDFPTCCASSIGAFRSRARGTTG